MADEAHVDASPSVERLLERKDRQTRSTLRFIVFMRPGRHAHSCGLT